MQEQHSSPILVYDSQASEWQSLGPYLRAEGRQFITGHLTGNHAMHRWLLHLVK